MNATDQYRWEHILETAEAVAHYAAVAHDEFRRDGMRQDACVYRLLVIGEAAARLVPTLDAMPEFGELREAVRR